MSVLFKILFINDIVVPMFAIFCNLLLLWLIKTVKTKTLIHLNYSLVPNSALDIIVSMLNFVVAPHIFHINGYLYIVFGNLFGSMNANLGCHISAILGALTMINTISVTTSFYIQYLVICKNQTLFIRTMFIPYFLLFFAFITFYILFLWFNLSNLGYFDTQVLIDFWIAEYGRPPLFNANKIVSLQFLSITALLLVMLSLAYGLMFYYSMQISKTLKTHIDANTSGTKLMHKQIHRTLFIQALGPCLIDSLPLLLIVSNSFLQIKSTELSLILSLFFPWISIINSVAAFLFIKPYRNYFKTMYENVLVIYRSQGKTLIIVTPVENKT